MSENQVQLKELDAIILELVAMHSEEVELDNVIFVDLLKNSLSLNLSEKKRVIDAVPTLSQFQFNELMKVFKEEREKFRELAQEHAEDIQKLYAKQVEEWNELVQLYVKEKEAKAELEALKSDEEDEQQKIDDIKKSLGL